MPAGFTPVSTRTSSPLSASVTARPPSGKNAQLLGLRPARLISRARLPSGEKALIAPPSENRGVEVAVVAERHSVRTGISACLGPYAGVRPRERRRIPVAFPNPLFICFGKEERLSVGGKRQPVRKEFSGYDFPRAARAERAHVSRRLPPRLSRAGEHQIAAHVERQIVRVREPLAPDGVACGFYFAALGVQNRHAVVARVAKPYPPRGDRRYPVGPAVRDFEPREFALLPEAADAAAVKLHEPQRPVCARGGAFGKIQV